MTTSQSYFAWLAALVVGLGGALVGAPSASASGQVVFADDFEDGNTDGWGGNGTIQAVESPLAPNGGTYSGRVQFSSSCWGPSLSFDEVAAESLSWYFRTDGDTGHDSGVGFGVGASGDLLTLISYHNGSLRYRDNQTTATYLPLQPATLGTWYLIELTNFDWDLGTYDIWVDGVNKVVGAPFMAPDLAGATGFFNYACPGVSGPSYVDNVTVTVAYDTPSTKTDCKRGGWQSYTDDLGTPFKNQGDCVSYVATNARNAASG